jgi:hypothetical protein
MTTACTGCGAATADHMLTAFTKMYRADRRSALLCPRCYDAWWESETGPPKSRPQGPGRPGQNPMDVA